MFVMSAQEFEQPGLRIEAVAQQDVEAAGMMIEDPLNQPHRRRAFIFLGPQQFKIQQEPEILTEQLKDDGPVVVLDALLAVDRDFALLAVLTAALVTVVDFMAIDHGETVTPDGLEDFVAAQPPIHLAQYAAQPRQIQDLGDVGDLVPAGHPMTQQFTPTALPPVLVQRIEARLAGEEENQDCRGKGGSRNVGFLPVVLGLGQEAQQSEDLLSVT